MTNCPLHCALFFDRIGLPHFQIREKLPKNFHNFSLPMVKSPIVHGFFASFWMVKSPCPRHPRPKRAQRLGLPTIHSSQSHGRSSASNSGGSCHAISPLRIMPWHGFYLPEKSIKKACEKPVFFGGHQKRGLLLSPVFNGTRRKS